MLEVTIRDKNHRIAFFSENAERFRIHSFDEINRLKLDVQREVLFTENPDAMFFVIRHDNRHDIYPISSYTAEIHY